MTFIEKNYNIVLKDILTNVLFVFYIINLNFKLIIGIILLFLLVIHVLNYIYLNLFYVGVMTSFLL